MHLSVLILCCALAAALPTPAVASLSWPASAAELPTTSGAVYLANLDARIGALEKASMRKPSADLQVALAGARYHRYRVRARLEDAEAALALLDAALVAQPAHVDARLLRASVLSGFHRFPAARADLAIATDLGADATALADAQAEIALATGSLDVPGSLRADDGKADFYRRSLRGNLLFQMGDPSGAAQQFERAQALYRDSSPMPLAWLHLQQGIALLRQDRCADAARFFRAAHERLPGYTLATEHLAECERQLGHLDEARRLYRQVIADTGSPEFLAALADLERDAGQHEQAKALQARAIQTWDAWLARNPAAFAQHAIPFLLHAGQPERALALAQDNIALRQDVGSWLLLAEARLATDDRAGACAARESARATGLRPPELAELDGMVCEASPSGG